MFHYRRLFCFLLSLMIVFGLCSGCDSKDQDQNTDPTEPAGSISYSVTVQNEAGTALDRITVEIYSDASKEDILQAQKTDDNGMIHFSRKGSADGLVAVLLNVPVGYQVSDTYALTGKDTVITLKSGALLTDSILDSARLSLSDPMPDFAVTASDGTACTLSELLEEYKAVVLNFWYMGCTPCKMEFPYLQQAYAQFSDDVAVIAMNPMDSTDDEIETFRQTNGYSFMMGKCDLRWGNLMNISSYPTTVVVDRYGNITMIHNGSVDNAQFFLDIFGYFCAEDYEQTFIRSHSQLPTYEP